MYDDLYGAVNPSLIELLRGIAEDTRPVWNEKGVVEHVSRYHSNTMLWLMRRVAGWQNPALLIRNLAFLVATIERSHKERQTPSAVSYLFGDRGFASLDGIAEDFRGMASATDVIETTVDTRGLVTRDGHGREHVLPWGGVLVLPPFFNLACDFTGGSLVTDTERLGKATSLSEIQAVIRDWERSFEDWRKTFGDSPRRELGSYAYFSKRLREIDQELGKTETEGTGASPARAYADQTSHLRDETVLAAWDEEQALGTGNYVKFDTVAQIAMRLWNATEAGLEQQAEHLRIDLPATHEDEGGTVREERLDASDLKINEEWDSIRTVLESADLKLLKKTEQRWPNAIREAGSAAWHLPLTLLRAEVFGDHQAKLTHAKAQAPEALAGLLECETADSTNSKRHGITTYADAVDEIEQLAERIDLLRDCCLHVLLHFRTLYAMERVREKLPHLECWRGFPRGASSRMWSASLHVRPTLSTSISAVTRRHRSSGGSCPRAATPSRRSTPRASRRSCQAPVATALMPRRRFTSKRTRPLPTSPR